METPVRRVEEDTSTISPPCQGRDRGKNLTEAVRVVASDRSVGGCHRGGRRGGINLYAPTSRLSLTDIKANSRRPSGTWTIPRVTIFSGGSLWMSRPSKEIRPAVVFISPEMVWRRIDLPASLPPQNLDLPTGAVGGAPGSDTCKFLTILDGPAVGRAIAARARVMATRRTEGLTPSG